MKQTVERAASYSGANARVVLTVAFIFGLAILGVSFGSPDSVKVSAQTGDDPLPRPEATIAIFTNSANITINDSASPPTIAAPYPSTITVSGMPNSMSNLRVTIIGLTHTFPDDIDIILVGPQGQRSILMSDAGGGGDVTLLPPLGFDQSAVNTIPDSTTLTGGLFKPANYTDSPNDSFPAPGPAVGVTDPADLSVFNGTNPNGVWSLYIVDDANVDGGFISQGWRMDFTVPAVTVTKIADTNDGVCDADCSLREAIAVAAPGETVLFSSLFNSPQTITLGGTELTINKNLTIQGPGANLLTVNGNSASRVFNVGAFTVGLSGMTVTGGNAFGGFGGGGIFNNGTLTVTNSTISGNTGSDIGGGIFNLGALTVTNSTISGNTANDGGGILNGGTLTVTNSTISGNTAALGGGGIFNTGGNTLTVTNSTISGNTANGGGGGGGGIENLGNLTVTNSTVSSNLVPNGNNNGGGIRTDLGNATITNGTITNNSAAGASSASGIFRQGATVTLRNSIIAANQNNATQPDVVASGGTGITSNGYNLIGNRGTVAFAGTGDQSGTGAAPLNPQLGALANNGGPTATHALLGASPALDKGDNTGSGQTTDQRGAGFSRTVDLAGITNAADGTDIGAYEAATAPAACTPTTTITEGDLFTGGLTIFTVTSDSGTVTVDHVNAGLGLQSLTVIGVPTNAIINIPAFTPGTTAPVIVTFTPIDSSQPVDFTLRAQGGAPGPNSAFIRARCGGAPAPTAASAPTNVMTAGATSYTFTATYTDFAAINVSTINTGDVSVNLPLGFSTTPTFVSVDNPANGTPRTATYSFTPPGGSWDAADNGTYNVVMQSGQVQNTSNVAVSAGRIATFTVNISTPTPTSTSSATSTPTPSCGTTVSYTSPAVSIPDNLPAGVDITLPVSGVGTITDLNFRFDTAGACDATVGNTNAAVDHTFIGDLTFKLTSPVGNSFSFQARRGGTRENICLTNFNEGVGFPFISTLTSVSGSPESGNFSPETTGMFTDFVGQNANGNWILNVSDNEGVDTGSVRRFSLIFNSEGPCSTPTNTPTPNTSVSGTITYGNAINAPAPPRFVKNVSLASTAGSPPVGPVITGTPGTYTLTGFGAGSYTIKPTKPGGPNGAITSNDAARVAQGVTGSLNFVSQNQRFAADVSGNGGVTSNDAALIARFAAGLTGTGNAGQWKFFVTGAPSPLPTAPQTYDDSRTYATVSSNLTGEDFVGILVGEVSGNWNPATHPRPVNSGQWTVDSEDGGARVPITVAVQDVTTAAEKEIVFPVSVQGVADKGVISYEFDLRYDPTVIQPLENPVDVAGTVSRGLLVVTNPYEPGLLRVVVYGPMPIDENGVLLNLRFTAVGAVGSISPLVFERILFNEGEFQTLVTDGKTELN